MRNLSRRSALASISAAGGYLLAPAAVSAENDIPAEWIRRHDVSLEGRLRAQNTDPESPWRGGYAGSDGLHQPGSAAAILEGGTAAFLHPQSRFHKDGGLFERMKLAAGFLERHQSPQGNIDLLTTNFNSPPDTGFVVHHAATAARLAQMRGESGIVSLIEPFLKNAGRGMARGGVHTPNHRWVVCAALAQIHELFPDPEYTKRIDQWLAEGIDIDDDGQFTERSTTVYNAVCCFALVTMARKLNRPALLDPVRKNLDSMLYLLHPNFEVVTEISRRQDVNTRGTMERYWFPLRHMAVEDQNGQYAAVLETLEPERIQVPALMEYPDLLRPLPAVIPVPNRYEKYYRRPDMTRIRKGDFSAAVLHSGNSRFIGFRKGDAAVNAVRFASAFFGKGQFVPERGRIENGAHVMTQSMEAGYYQPLDPPRKVEADGGAWGEARREREITELCRMEYRAEVRMKDNGLEIAIRAAGTDHVPLAVEINLREGGEIAGVHPAGNAEDSFVLESGWAEYRMGGNAMRFGPGAAPHRYTQVRGALDKLPGPSVYIMGYTPFEHTLRFEWI